MVASSKVFYSNAKQDILRSAEKMPEDKYAFKPVDTVRSYGQVLAHVADGQYEFCGAAAGKHDEKGIEKTLKPKPISSRALKTAFAYCDAIYAGMTDAKASRNDTGLRRNKDHPAQHARFQRRSHHGALRQFSNVHAHPGHRTAQQRTAPLTHASA